ncbi:MAG: biopolymer transporter ExbD [Treponema sp.]|nr:biopolymer transporter ExbD [Treponema sp.]
MQLHAHRRAAASNIDMTPMIDVVFQLILFFLVSTTFAVMPGISLNLPASSTAQSTATSGIIITADKNDGLWFNDKKVTFKTLGDELAAYDTKNKKKDEIPITLEADSEVTNGTIVQIFDVIRGNGYSAVDLRTKQK